MIQNAPKPLIHLGSKHINLSIENLYRLGSIRSAPHTPVIHTGEEKYYLEDLDEIIHYDNGVLNDNAVIDRQLLHEMLKGILDGLKELTEIDFDSLPRCKMKRQSDLTCLKQAIKDHTLPEWWTKKNTLHLRKHLIAPYDPLVFLAQGNPKLHVRLLTEGKCQDSKPKIIRELLFNHEIAVCDLWLKNDKTIRYDTRQAIQDYLSYYELSEELIWFINWQHENYDLEKEAEKKTKKQMQMLTAKPGTVTALKQKFHFSDPDKNNTICSLFPHRYSYYRYIFKADIANVPLTEIKPENIFPNIFYINKKQHQDEKNHCLEVMYYDYSAGHFKRQSIGCLRTIHDMPKSKCIDKLLISNSHIDFPAKIGKSPVHILNLDLDENIQSVNIPEGIQYIRESCFFTSGIRHLVLPSTMLLMNPFPMPHTMKEIVILSENCAFTSARVVPHEHMSIHPISMAQWTEHHVAQRIKIYVPKESNTFENLKTMIAYCGNPDNETITNIYSRNHPLTVFGSICHPAPWSPIENGAILEIIPLNQKNLLQKAEELKMLNRQTYKPHKKENL